MIKLYRFPYSCYALKVQYLLDKLQLDYEIVDVPYADRAELVKVTGGRVLVPAIVHDGQVVVDSRTICEYLLGLTENQLVPPGQAATIWAYADWCDSILEDVLFRIATPGIAAKFATPFETALFAFIKERKFGTGCVKAWQKTQPDLIANAQVLLETTLASIAVNGYVAGEAVSYADITLLGHLAIDVI
ncbi:MAG: glutathione S-transferase [Leptolyngbya sp. SIO1D8]|nr:glutathione S-transferase [Leptolyngbya sp. SIO1D8]